MDRDWENNESNRLFSGIKLLKNIGKILSAQCLSVVLIFAGCSIIEYMLFDPTLIFVNRLIAKIKNQ